MLLLQVLFCLILSRIIKLKRIITWIVRIINKCLVKGTIESSSVSLSRSWYAIKLSVKWHHKCLLWIHNWMRSLINIFFYLYLNVATLSCWGIRAGVLWDTKVPHCPLFPILVYHRRVSRCYNSRWNCWPLRVLVITVCFVPIVLYFRSSYLNQVADPITFFTVISSLNSSRFGRYVRTK